jgi:hypothetical protein
MQWTLGRTGDPISPDSGYTFDGSSVIFFLS